MNEQPTRTLSDLAELVAGTLSGNGETKVIGVAPLDEVAPGQLTFIDQSARAAQAADSAAAAILVPSGMQCDGKPTIEVDDVFAAFATLVTTFKPQRATVAKGISPTAHVSSSAQLADDVSIGPGASVGDDVIIGQGTIIHAGAHLMAGCRIGAGVVIFGGAVLYEDTEIGDHSIIHAGAIIGAYGFGYRQQDGAHKLSAQLGNVVIGRNVEIGASATIDRGTFSATRIGDGTKVDNLVQIAHNCQIGKHNLLCAQVGIAGSTSTGDYVVMAGQVGVRDHVHIGDGARIGAMAGVSNDIAPGVVAFGAPAIPERDQKILLASLAKLPEMRKEFKKLRKEIGELQTEPRSRDEGTAGAAMDPAA